VGLDTSVVLRLLVGEPADQVARAVAFLDNLRDRDKAAAVSDLVISETYFALLHHYAVPKREDLAALRQFVESEEIVCLGRARKVLATPGLASAKPGMVDRLIHGEYEMFAAGMVSFEKAAAKLAGCSLLGV
jgi:predicted nucleic acid-binding protein